MLVVRIPFVLTLQDSFIRLNLSIGNMLEVLVLKNAGEYAS